MGDFFTSSQFRWAALTAILSAMLHPFIMTGLRATDGRAPFDFQEIARHAVNESWLYGLVMFALLSVWAAIVWRRNRKGSE